VNVSEDLLNRQIQDYGLVSPERAKKATPVTSAPVERLFSVAGQVDSSRRANLSSDNLTLLVFMHEPLPLLRKIRDLKIVQEVVGSDAAQDRTCTARAVVRSGHRTTARAMKKLKNFFFCPFSSRFDPFHRASFPRTKTIFFSAKKKISVSKIV
jgi:hypothetical protein